LRRIAEAILIVAFLMCEQRDLFAQRAAGRPSPGHTRELAVGTTPEPPAIDGLLDPLWLNAPVAGEFWISEYRQAPAERTEVRVLADEHAIYFAITAYDSDAASIHADQTQRDRSMGLDDQVTIELDPYHNHRLISRFSVNANGTQSDALAGGRGRKIDWKGDWQAAARRTEGGWIAEIAIPFQILEYQSSVTVFGVNFIRYHARTQEWSRWADVTPQYLPEETGHLVGLKLPSNQIVSRLAVMPYAAGGVNVRDRHGVMRERDGNAGVDVRLDLARKVTNVLSVRPDFSQIEATVLDVSFNYNEKYRFDPRPFFQEGAAFFGDRSYFYSTRIPDFLAGGKTFGRFGGFQTGALATVDDLTDRKDYVASVRRELGATAAAGVTFVGSDQGTFSNQLVGLQSSGRVAGRITYGLDVSASSTQGQEGDGTRSIVSLGYAGPYLQFGLTGDKMDRFYFPANGLIAGDLPGTQGLRPSISLGRGFGTGWLKRADASVGLNKRETIDGDLQREEWSLYASAETRSNIQVSGGASVGPYRPREGAGWADFLYDDRYYTATVGHYSGNGRFGYGLTYSWGFLAVADYSDFVPYVWVKPTATTSVDYTFERAHHYDLTKQHILSASWDVTREDTISGRWVQYNDDPYLRLAYRRQMRRGIDVFAVFNDEPYADKQFVAKVVWTLNLIGGGTLKAP
jgi:hypothetical protein